MGWGGYMTRQHCSLSTYPMPKAQTWNALPAQQKEVNHLKDISTHQRASQHPQAPTTDLSQTPTHLSKSVKRLTRNVCCLSSLYPSAFFTASTAWAGEAYSRKMYLSEKASSLHTCTLRLIIHWDLSTWTEVLAVLQPPQGGVTLKTRVHAEQIVS